MKVLVSAAGSPLGQSVVKALMNSKLDLDIFIIDHSEFAAGFHIFPDLKKFVAPSVASSEYDTFMTNLLVENQINLIQIDISLNKKLQLFLILCLFTKISKRE